MKIKGLLLGMLAYAAMVACTNEDIVKNNVNQPEKVKGNLSLVISSTSNSSRAADNEESGVTDPGIEGESTVTDAVIISLYLKVRRKLVILLKKNSVVI